MEAERLPALQEDEDSDITALPQLSTNGSATAPHRRGLSNGRLKLSKGKAVLQDSAFPNVPEHQPGQGIAGDFSGQSPSLEEGFPFQAQPGSVEPRATTRGLNIGLDDKADGVEKDASSTSLAQRRNVSFVQKRNGEIAISSPQNEEGGTAADGAGDTRMKDRQASFLNKLKSFKPQHVRSSSSPGGVSTPHGAFSPQSEKSEPSYPLEASEAADADVEEDSDDGPSTSPVSRRKRKSRRPVNRETESTPTTPRQSRFASFIRDHPMPGSARPAPSRRTTTSDLSDHGMVGVSEDEGRDRIRNAWRRGIEGAKGLGQSKSKPQDEGETTDTGRRPGHLRRFTGIGHQDGSPSPFRMRAERQASSTAQKWRQVKAGLKMLGQKRREERMRIDHQKSTQLIAELLAGTPSALIFASMFQRDEHGHRKVSVLLEQLKIRIPHINTKDEERNPIFDIELEYGNGPARLRWKIQRSLQDFITLHFKYRSRYAAGKVRHPTGDDKTKPKIPKFPKSAFPYARTVRGLFTGLEDEDDEEDMQGSEMLDGAPGTPGVRGHTRRKSSFAPPRRTSTGGDGTNDPETLSARQRDAYHERQRIKLETYLQQMIRWLIFRPDSTRLCKFLEVSALAVRLSAEGGFQGKQGLMNIASRQNRELRRKKIGPAAFKERHKTRWFLVRHSYVVCVDGPESLNPYDVFLVDSDFRIGKKQKRIADQKSATEMAGAALDATAARTNKHTIRLYNAERKLKLIARSERQHFQFQESLNRMMAATIWAKKQRFNSFAPVRNNVWARWLVDGRDYMWQVSRAIDNAKDFVYIHDWWLSPELYLRRPPAISQKWRMDRLLQRKAQEGVKIFVIVYRNIESAIPIDSEYTKWSLLDLHENICIQRSPNQFRQNQFFWAHHEKLVVVDNVMAFCGGLDLCFGRWDDPCHPLTDDKLTGFELDQNVPRDSEHCQVWAGKDYSNPRVQDFYALDRPYEEMYDRTRVPRMPWHDIGMQMVGQPARDLGRHFVQRWNYILRSRIPSRPTPVLIPPPEFEQAELDRLGMSGTCQIQITRSAGQWSLGTPKTEASIATAYCHLIKHSDHFIYIENQFYVSSCTVEGTVIHNKIGDAITERAIQAYEKGESWKACLLIPLMPGFQSSVDSQDGTSIRLIMQCQYRSICRGESSIFGRLRARGIDPERYVHFYSLRQWGKIGPRKSLTTEQLYIHAKCMIVDDRTVIIGSANINERSMLGNRDSEVAAVVTDTKMLMSKMGGKPYQVGEFAHTLRKRLMREHLGIDTDAVYRREQASRDGSTDNDDTAPSNGYHDNAEDQSQPARPLTQENLRGDEYGVFGTNVPEWNTAAAKEDRVMTDETADKKMTEEVRNLDVQGYGFDNMTALTQAGDNDLLDTVVDSRGREVLVKHESPGMPQIQREDEHTKRDLERQPGSPSAPPWPAQRTDTTNLGLAPRSQLPELPMLDDSDIGGPVLLNSSGQPARFIDAQVHNMGIRLPEVTEDCMTDPLAPEFWNGIWHQVAENNTKIYRQVFRCMPDNEVTDWKTYERFNDYNERFMQSQGLGSTKPNPANGKVPPSGPVGSQQTAKVASSLKKEESHTESAKSNGKKSFFSRFRPGSRASNADTVNTEKSETQNGVAASPGSGPSVPSAVPSPQPQPLDEKEAAKRADEAAGLLAPSSTNNTNNTGDSIGRQRSVRYAEGINSAPETTATQSAPLQPSGSVNRRRRGTTKSSTKQTVPNIPIEEVLSQDQAEEVLNLVQGNLVLWPYDWLEKEERGGNWLYNIDQLAPLEIYD